MIPLKVYICIFRALKRAQLTTATVSCPAVQYVRVYVLYGRSQRAIYEPYWAQLAATVLQ